MKKTILISFLMLFALVTNAYNFEVDGIYYRIIDNDNVSVTYKGEFATWYHSYSGDVVIPDSVSYNDRFYKVSEIGDDAFYECGELTSVVIPNSITVVGDQAFRGCSSLTSMTIPNSVTSLGSCSFYECSGLTSLIIGNSVTNIGDYAFLRCTKLTSIIIPSSVSSIGQGAFDENGGLMSIIVEEGNQNYDSRDNCNALIETATNKLIQGCKRTIIPNTVDSIGVSAFSWCTGLYNITIPNSVKSIGRTAFWYCSNLKTITIGNSVEEIGEGAFGYCTSLTELTIPNSVINMIGDICYHCNSLNKVTIGNSVISIGDWAFRYCNISSITIPKSVTSIGEYAFGNCYYLSSIVIPNSVTSIGNLAFDKCNSLRTVYLTGKNEWIAGELPNTTSNLYIEGGITSVKGMYLNPSNIYCYATVPPECDGYSFTDYSGTLHVPASSLALYFTAPYWCNFANIVGDAIGANSINLNKTSLELITGDQEVLVASVQPSNANPKIITWNSSNEDVATVINGEVTAIGQGECDIKVTCFNNVEAYCHVIVKDNVADEITIYLDTNEVQMLPNHIITLTPSASPILPDLTVSSSDPTVAAARVVSDKVQVVGIKEGTATITVGSVDGTAIPATCLVTVYTEPGDINCDGFVNISDVTSLIDYLLSGDESQISTKNADVNGDESINISDVTELIDILLSGNG